MNSVKGLSHLTNVQSSNHKTLFEVITTQEHFSEFERRKSVCIEINNILGWFQIFLSVSIWDCAVLLQFSNHYFWNVNTPIRCLRRHNQIKEVDESKWYKQIQRVYFNCFYLKKMKPSEITFAKRHSPKGFGYHENRSSYRYRLDEDHFSSTNFRCFDKQMNL